VDIAIRDNILYADSYTDLVVIDISNPENIKEIRRIRNIFPDIPLPSSFLAALDPENVELISRISNGKAGIY
jgi:LVIVD repeat